MISGPRFSFCRSILLLLLGMLIAASVSCRRAPTGGEPAYAYIANGKSDTVTVVDLATMQPVRTLNVGKSPTGLAASPTKHEVYVVNTDSGTVSVIDSRSNQVIATIGVQRTPYYISLTADGRWGYVANGATW